MYEKCVQEIEKQIKEKKHRKRTLSDSSEGDTARLKWGLPEDIMEAMCLIPCLCPCGQ